MRSVQVSIDVQATRGTCRGRLTLPNPKLNQKQDDDWTAISMKTPGNQATPEERKAHEQIGPRRGTSAMRLSEIGDAIVDPTSTVISAHGYQTGRVLQCNAPPDVSQQFEAERG